MLNKFISMFLICLVCLTAFSPIQLKAQNRENQFAQKNTVKSDKKVEPLSLKQFFANSIIADPLIQLDTKKMEKENLDSMRKSKLSKGQKTALYIGIPAAIAAVVIIIVATRNGKSGNGCLTVCETAGCPPLC